MTCPACDSTQYDEYRGCLGCKECECGRPKNKGRWACAECSEADGINHGGRLIAALRMASGPLTIKEITEFMGSEHDAAERAVHRLAKKGRLERLDDGVKGLWRLSYY